MYIFLDRYVYLGLAVGRNPGYLKLRKIRAAQSIARTVCFQLCFPFVEFEANVQLFFFFRVDRQLTEQSVLVGHQSYVEHSRSSLRRYDGQSAK